MKHLTLPEKFVLLDKGTEPPFSSELEQQWTKGTYLCRQCQAPLFVSTDKFDAHCGWPSFDNALSGAVLRLPDADGRRTEIRCNRCGGHLGHVFEGERHTPLDTRYCVNGLSLEFTPQSVEELAWLETAIFAGGCFWGVEYWMAKEKGVLTVTSGYTGGHLPHPTYQDVCSHTSGHAEAVSVVFDPDITTFEHLATLFFNIHDPEQIDRQGPDVGSQYRSEIFYTNPEQEKIAKALIDVLVSKGFNVATRVTAAGPFWEAELHHQQYYEHKGTLPYCHVLTNRL
jgi:peptide methionine sulfoxide reductase msrA/msrB